ncbi:MAG: AAA family ATPase [Pseudomonadota bacterium]|nr:AAA family ATPase [Pseudomonadota bacterium]
MPDPLLPILCWKLLPDLYVGRRAVTDDAPDVARSSLSGVTAAVKQAIERGDDLEEPEEIEEVRLLRMILPVRPSEEREKGRTGSAHTLPLPVDVVHARLASGIQLAEIVNFRHVFRFLDATTLETLVTHFVQEEAGHLSVDALFQSGLLPAPTLEISHVPRRRKLSARPPPPSLERLGAIAEKVTGPPPGWPGVWERAAEIETVLAALSGRGSFVVTGPPRVGRSAILYEAVRRLKKTTPVFRTRAQRLVAGAKYLGQWQELCEQMVSDLREVDGVLWIEDLPALLQTGGRGPSDSVAAYLRPALDEGLRLIGEVTPAQMEAMRGRLPGFLDAFEEIRIAPLAEPAQAEIVQRLSELHARLGTRIEPRGARLARRLLDRFVRTEQFPGKLVNLLAEAVARAKRDGKDTVDEAGVLALFTERTGMPPILLDDRIPLDPVALRTWLDRRILGQPEASAALVEVITTFKAGLNDGARPVATLLLAGPTGVGKTATARALAEWCFGGDTSLVRIDMSECQHPEQIARLIGNPDGEPGELVRKVRERPFSVVLFDEIEKAHPVFFDSLLSVLDQGTLTDAWGRVTDFRGCVILLTTNLGARRGASLGFSDSRPIGGDLDRAAIRNFFRPELINRLDRIVAFHPLDTAAVRRIAEREIELLSERPGLAGRGIRLLCSDAILDRVVRAGFDPQLGARPLQRVIEHVIVAAVARYLLSHPEVSDTVLVVEDRDGEVVVG